MRLDRLRRDIVAFLLLAPLFGAIIASVGLWLVLLVFATPAAILAAYLFAAAPAMAAFAAARLMDGRHPDLCLIVTLAAAMAVTFFWFQILAMWLFVSPIPKGWLFWWTGSGGVATLLTLGVRDWIHRPGRVAAWIIGLQFSLCLTWYVVKCILR